MCTTQACVAPAWYIMASPPPPLPDIKSLPFIRCGFAVLEHRTPKPHKNLWQKRIAPLNASTLSWKHKTSSPGDMSTLIYQWSNCEGRQAFQSIIPPPPPPPLPFDNGTATTATINSQSFPTRAHPACSSCSAVFGFPPPACLEKQRTQCTQELLSIHDLHDLARWTQPILKAGRGEGCLSMPNRYVRREKPRSRQ